MKLTGKFTMDETMIRIAEKADARKALKIFKETYTFEDIAAVYTESANEYVPYADDYGFLEVQIFDVGDGVANDDISNCRFYVRFYMLSWQEIRRVTLYLCGNLETCFNPGVTKYIREK